MLLAIVVVPSVLTFNVLRTHHVDGAEESGSYKGCYHREHNQMFNLVSMKWFGNEWVGKLTPGICYAHCMDGGYSYYGLIWGNTCGCTNELPSEMVKRSDDYCNFPCFGDGSAKCGRDGWWDDAHTDRMNAVNIYETVPEQQSQVYLGCYHHQDNTMLLWDDMEWMGNVWTSLLTNTGCFHHCLAGGYAYYGLMWGNQCVCGNNAPSDTHKKGEDYCNLDAVGEEGVKAGRSGYFDAAKTDKMNAVNIYETGVF